MDWLALKLPTVLQVTASNAILFHEAGVSEFKHDNWHPAFNAVWSPPSEDLPRLWTLVDTNPNLLRPVGILRHSSPFFIVNAMSPYPNDAGWLDKVCYNIFYMKPWSILEVIQAYVDLALGGSQRSPPTVALSSVKNPTQNISSGICTISLAHPQALAFYAHDPKHYEGHLREELGQIETSQLPHMFRDPGSSRASHYIVIVHPSRASRSLAPCV